MKKDNLPLVSIVIPIYNTEIYLRKCLESVISQTYLTFEVILVDDGSPDQAYIIAEEFCNNDKRFSLIRQNNIGLSGSRNTGILNACGKYILFLDSDDTLTIDAIEGLVAIAEKENADIVITDRYYKIIESTNEKTLEYHFSEIEYISDPVQFTLKVIIGKCRAWRATAVLYNSNIIKSNNIFFPVGYTGEDIVFNMLFLSCAKRISFYNLPTLLNLKRKGSITTSYNEQQMKMFLFIDERTEEFIIRNEIDYQIGEKYKNSLLKRNIIVALTSLMSPQNKETITLKFEKARRILENERVLDAFKNLSEFSPYFNSKKVVFYFQIMNFLISNGIYFPAFVLAFIAGKKSVLT